METPVFKTSVATQLPENTNCLAWSEDGQYLSVGHSGGLSLWGAPSFSCIAQWSQEALEITSIQITRMAEKAYMLGTIDDMGVARILVFWSENIHLLNIINTLENINNRNICLSFGLSQGGDYGFASVSCNGAVWLEVFNFPVETWLKELGTVTEKKDSNLIGSELQWSPVLVINKIKPIQTVSDSVSESFSQFYSHCLALDGKMSSPAGSCTAHFLLPLSGDRKEMTGLPNAICMWWSGSHNLLQYSLLKETKNKSDLQSFPCVLWPNANKIVCSAVSGCTRYIGLGLTDAVVCVWNRHFGSLLSVLSLSETSSVFSQIQFVDNHSMFLDQSQSCSDAQLRLTVMCKSGAMYTVIMGQGLKVQLLQLAERVKDSGDLPTVATAVPFLQDLLLVIQRNGKMFLQDVINKTNVCSLILPSTHVLATSHNPVFAFNSQDRTLVIQGDQDYFSKEDCYSQLYIFHFEECDIVKPYIITTDSARQRKMCSFVTLEDSCNQYLQKRLLSANETTKDLRKRWLQLTETSVIVQQGTQQTT